MVEIKDSNNDLLRDFINPGNIEKAPADFTSGIMNLVRNEPIPQKNFRAQLKRNSILVYSFAVTGVLMLAALLLPDSNESLLSSYISGVIKNIQITVPDVNFQRILPGNTPSFIIYILLAVLILSLFDIALHQRFSRGREER
jgi:hypothetical protein